MKKRKRKGFDTNKMRCPYCGAPVTLRSADSIYKNNSHDIKLYVCTNYPKCDLYVRVHAGTNIPVGTMTNHELRTLRRTAHHYFDKLHKIGIMSKQVIEESRKVLDRYNSLNICRMPPLTGGAA